MRPGDEVHRARPSPESSGLRSLLRLSDDGGQVPGKILPPVETPFLKSRDRCSGLIEICLGRGRDQVAEIRQILVAASENLQRDQVPDRFHRHEDTR